MGASVARPPSRAGRSCLASSVSPSDVDAFDHPQAVHSARRDSSGEGPGFLASQGIFWAHRGASACQLLRLDQGTQDRPPTPSRPGWEDAAHAGVSATTTITGQVWPSPHLYISLQPGRRGLVVGGWTYEPGGWGSIPSGG